MEDEVTMEPPQKSSATRHGFPYEDAASTTMHPEYACCWAVIIGIDKYSYLSPLKYAVDDAKGMAKTLLEEFDFEDKHIITLVNEQATREEIRKILIDQLPNQTQLDDSVLIFFAGHGEKRKLPGGAEKGYLAPVDAQRSQWTTYLAISELMEAANMTAAKHIFYIVDCCYSGFATTRANFQATRFQRDLLTHRARQVLTAGLDDQVVSDIGPNGHSIFTYHLIEGLKSFASSGSITASELITYVRENVGNDQSSRQTPDYGLLVGHESGGDFVFISKAKSDSSGCLALLGATLFKEEEGQKSQELQALQEYISDQQDKENLERVVLAIVNRKIDPRTILS